MPAFLLSEIRRGFEVGFLIFLPFLVIDLVIAAVLMSMGMMMVPPAVVSLPFKLAFFVIADGWSLLAGALVRSYAHEPTPRWSRPRRGRRSRGRRRCAPEQMPAPIEKAAMILTAIGPELAAGFLRDLAEPDMERFARAIGGLGKISQEVLDAVIVEFLELLTTGPEISGGSKAARKLLAAVLDDEDEVQRLIDGRRRSEVRSVWERLNDTPRARRWRTSCRPSIRRRRRWSCRELRAEVAASVLERLERGFAQTVVLRLSRVPTLDPPIAASIQGAIERDFLSVLQRNLSKRRPADLIAGLMNNISTEVREGFLSYLEAQEPSLAQDVQRTMFTFEDIAVRLHGRDVAGVLRDVSEEVLLKALKLGEAQSSADRAPSSSRTCRGGCRSATSRSWPALDRRQPQGGRVGADRDHQGDPGPGEGRARSASSRRTAPSAEACTRRLHVASAHAVSKSITRMIATTLPLFWVPSVVSSFVQVQTSPFLAVNVFSFWTTESSPSVMWQSMSFIMTLSGVFAPGSITTSRSLTVA